MDDETKIAISQEYISVYEEVKNKQGQINSINSFFEIDLSDISYIQNNIKISKQLSVYLDEYIVLATKLIKLKKELLNLNK